jgi:hypothetical protein
MAAMGGLINVRGKSWFCLYSQGEFVVFFWCKAKLFGGTDRFNLTLELDFVVFSGVKQSFLGVQTDSIALWNLILLFFLV